MNKELYDRGDRIRREVLGSDYVDRSNRASDDFGRALSEYSTENIWGQAWANDDLPRKTRSLINVALLAALNRNTELRTHLRGAINNGATKQELSAVVLHLAAYCGMPVAVDAMRAVREVLNGQEAVKS
jgi:4-carboxymuconolactone decarboxylase